MKIKARWAGFFFSLSLAVFLSAKCFISNIYAAATWPNDPDFLVGAVGHLGDWGGPEHWSGYGPDDSDIERQVHLLAEMGAKIYRMDVHRSANYVEKVITLCERYGIEVMLIIGNNSTDSDFERFKGRVKYYQVDNEIGGTTNKEDYWAVGTDISKFGMSTDVPRPPDNKCLDVRVNEVIGIIKRVRAIDPDVKILINGDWIHYALFDYAFERFAQEGVDIDLIGWDWYSDRENKRNSGHPSTIDGFKSVAKYVYDKYKKDIIICEYNMAIQDFDYVLGGVQNVPYLPGNGNGIIDLFEEDNMDTLIGPYLVNNIQDFYNNRKENHIKGIMIYELIEERGHPHPFEAKYGITYAKMLSTSQRRYQILGPKKAYYDVQKLLGGDFVPIQRLNPSAVLPEYTIKASVIDVNQDGVILHSQAGGTAAGSGIYRENAVVALTASAKPGYEFLGWYRGGIRISKNPVYKFTAYEDANNSGRDSSDGKFVYESRYVYRGAYEGAVITFPVISRNGVQSTGTMIVPERAFSEGVAINVKQHSNFAPADSYVRELNHTNIGVLIDAQGKKPEKEIEIRIPYNDSDTTGMNEDSLVISRYDEEKQVWVPLKSMSDKGNKQIIAKLDHLSIFAIMGTANAVKAFEDIKYYPNPIQPSKGLNYSRMQFSNIPAGTRIKIYTLLGQTVRELKADASGMAVWDGKNNAGEKAASGVYIVYMEDCNGNKKRIKIAVEK